MQEGLVGYITYIQRGMGGLNWCRNLDSWWCIEESIVELEAVFDGVLCGTP